MKIVVLDDTLLTFVLLYQLEITAVTKNDLDVPFSGI